MSQPESAQESRLRTVLLAYFPMFIATLSLVTSIYNGYLNSKFVDLIQRNIGRTEQMRTCKEIIDSYFQVKFRAGLVNGSGERGGSVGQSAQQIDAANAVNHFAALGTYLANLGDDRARVQYTQLSNELDKIVGAAGKISRTELEKMFEPADRLFADMNNDCVRSARAAM
jgi:hypothetical protein